MNYLRSSLELVWAGSGHHDFRRPGSDHRNHNPRRLCEAGAAGFSVLLLQLPYFGFKWCVRLPVFEHISLNRTGIKD